MKLGILCRALAALLITLSASAFGQQAPETLRVEVATPAKAGIDLLKAGKFADALAKVAEAEAVPKRTPYENFVLDQLRGGAAAGAGDYPTAIRSYEAVLATGRLPAADALPIMEGLTSASYRQKDYERAATWARRYFAEGGANSQVRRVLANALYQRTDWAGAAAELTQLTTDDEKAGRSPADDQLRMLGSSQLKQNDPAGYLATLERLLRWHPKPAYWRDRLGQLQRQPGFDDALIIDVYRLLQAVGALEDPAEYLQFAELAMAAGLPGEAKRVLEAGAAAGKLGGGADAARQKALRDRVDKSAAADAKDLERGAAPSPSATANSLVGQGLAYATSGQAERGLAFMEQGVAKPGLTRPDAARLRLAWVSVAAGRADKARAVLGQMLQATGGAGDLARLWLIVIDSKPAGS